MKLLIITILLSIIPSGVIAQGKEKSFAIIDYDKGEVGKNFTGHDIRKTVVALLEKAAPKKEFEKTAEYKSRIAKLENEPLIGDLKISDTFIFISSRPARSNKKIYDADSEILSYEFSSFDLYYAGDHINFDYQAVEKDLQRLGISSEMSGHRVAFPLPIKEAPQVKERLVIASCFVFEKPYLKLTNENGNYNVTLLGTIKNILILDPVTGHIYKKFPTESQTKSLSVPTEPTTPSFRVPEMQRVSGGVLNSKAINKVQPAYPAIAQAAHAQGAVQVAITVSKEGQVISAEAVGGHPLLKEAAVAAARQWTFQKTEISGNPVKIQGILTFNFTLP
jgi:TonB family protein